MILEEDVPLAPVTMILRPIIADQAVGAIPQSLSFIIAMVAGIVRLVSVYGGRR